MSIARLFVTRLQKQLRHNWACHPKLSWLFRFGRCRVEKVETSLVKEEDFCVFFYCLSAQ